MERLDFPYWNKVQFDNLSFEWETKDDLFFIRLYTNNINILNKKIENNEKNSIKMHGLLDIADKIAENYYGGNEERAKKLSEDFMLKVNLL